MQNENSPGTPAAQAEAPEYRWTTEEVKEHHREWKCDIAERFYVVVHGSLLKAAREELDHWYLTVFQQFKNGEIDEFPVLPMLRTWGGR